MLKTVMIVLAIQIVYSNGDYIVPEPHIKVLQPRGFRVSIPDEDGVQFFAFHGNVNKPMDGLEVGEFSKDILRSKRGKWIFEDHETKLKEGDVIFYWLFVIKDNLGYRRENGEFRVEEITSTSPEGSHEGNFHASLAHASPQFRPNNDIGYEIALKVSDIAGDLYEEVKKLKEINAILRELVMRNGEKTNDLKFEGVVPEVDDAQYAAQIVINEKLRIDVPVVNATRNADQSITFQVPSLDDKIYVIRTARIALVNSRIKLVY